VQRFVNAYMQAFADVINSPSEAADIIIEANPEYGPKKDVLVKQIEADVRATFFSADTKQHGIGWMTKETWGATTKILLEQGVLKQAVEVETVFNNKFLSNTNPLKR